MSQSLQTPVSAPAQTEDVQTHETAVDSGAECLEHRLNSFVGELRQMTRKERIRASRYSFDHWERWVYAARYPDEVPLINGEFEWIAATLE